MKEYINNLLKNKYKEFQKKFEILGCFIVGKANYGIDFDKEDLEVIAVTLPSFDDLCTKKPFSAGECYDIRLFYHLLPECDKALELLFSKYYIINPKYEKLFNTMFLAKREEIANYNKKERLHIVLNQMVKAMKCNDYIEFLRLYMATNLYIQGKKVEECFDLSNNQLALSFVQSLNPKKEDLDIFLKEIEEAYEKMEDNPNKEALNYVKKGVISIMDEYLNNNVDADTFVDALTEREKTAFKMIKDIAKENNDLVSLKKLTDTTDLSRPVFNNTIEKIKDFNIAKINNRGVKGTEILFNVDINV